MSDLLSGLVVAVSSVPVGTQTAAAASSGASLLLLDDTIDMVPSGGQVTIDGVVTDYASSDDDESTITLVTPLAATLAEGAEVLVYPPQVEMTALVLIDGASDPIPATVPSNMQDSLPVGVREEEDRERVRLTRDGEWSWAVFDAPGKPLSRDSAYIRSPYIAAYKTSDQMWPNNAWTTLSGLTATDREEIVHLGSGLFEIQADGLYECGVGVRFAINATGARAVRIAYNTAAGTVTSRVMRIAAVAGEQTTVETSQKRRLLPGDTVEFQAYQDSGASLNLFGAESGTVSTDMTILRVSP